MADGKIYIIITDKLPQDTPGPGPGPAPTPSGNPSSSSGGNKNNIILDYAAHQFFNLIKETTTKIINYQLNNVGNFTGDYITQRHINFARGNLNVLVGIGGAAVAGFKYGGPWGALIAATVATVATGVSGALDYNTNLIQNTKTNYAIAQLRERSGLNSLKDGSRGTEN